MAEVVLNDVQKFYGKRHQPSRISTWASPTASS